jgi:hypothetical protein
MTLQEVAPQTRARIAAVVLIVAALVITAVIAYRVGADRSAVKAMTGSAQVGDHMASIKADGRWYGVSAGVYWIDRHGTGHDGDWPACLAPVGARVQVRFGGILATAPDGTAPATAVWIDCRG